ncbi:MAG TPA: RdgB/HAM1 family non-canonical purine NTP pyrophosphatase [Nitrospiria bacterium]|nr:RdgB/HAM1 family non-canonical purine NTP pyrophosphatase [Nitrospiria bacterium]
MSGQRIKVVVATQNPHKVEEIRAILKDTPVDLVSLLDFKNQPEMREDGSTYAENAVQKAQIVAAFSGEWSLGDDTGLEVDALDGQPGLYSARYAGANASFSDNKQKLLSRMKNLPKPERGATFRTTLALVHPKGERHLAEGFLRGWITETEKGAKGFGYDALFFVPDLKKTFAELTTEEKNRYSHRARAVENMKKVLEKLASD